MVHGPGPALSTGTGLRSRAHLAEGILFYSKEHNMKTRWALFSAAIFFGFLSSQVTAAEAVLGQGNISCVSWIESRGDDNPLAATRTAWVLGFVTAFNQYGSKPEGDNLYNAAAALVDQLQQ